MSVSIPTSCCSLEEFMSLAIEAQASYLHTMTKARSTTEPHQNRRMYKLVNMQM